MSIIKVDEIQNVAGTQNKGVLQVVSATKTDAFTTTSTSNVDITGMTVTITPRSTDSKILCFASCHLGNNGTGYDSYVQLVRAISGGATTNIAINTDSATTAQKATLMSLDAVTYFQSTCSVMHLDSPSTTSAITYHLEGRTGTGGAGTFALNRRGDAATQGAVSNITAMEIQG